MIIRIIYQDDKHDMVKPFFVDSLIESGKIKKFLRSSGWVTIGHDPTRGIGGSYMGPDRRISSI
jgi:hypothetical protein